MCLDEKKRDCNKNTAILLVDQLKYCNLTKVKILAIIGAHLLEEMNIFQQRCGCGHSSRLDSVVTRFNTTLVEFGKALNENEFYSGLDTMRHFQNRAKVYEYLDELIQITKEVRCDLDLEYEVGCQYNTRKFVEISEIIPDIKFVETKVSKI